MVKYTTYIINVTVVLAQEVLVCRTTDTTHKPIDFNGKGRPQMKIILGTKIGMTQIIGEDGVVTPVTILQAGPCTVTQT